MAHFFVLFGTKSIISIPFWYVLHTYFEYGFLSCFLIGFCLFLDDIDAVRVEWMWFSVVTYILFRKIGVFWCFCLIFKQFYAMHLNIDGLLLVRCRAVNCHFCKYNMLIAV